MTRLSPQSLVVTVRDTMFNATNTSSHSMYSVWFSH